MMCNNVIVAFPKYIERFLSKCRIYSCKRGGPLEVIKEEALVKRRSFEDGALIKIS